MIETKSWPMTQQLTAMVVDDHRIFRRGMMSTLRALDRIGEVYEADNGESALEIFRQHPIEIVFMDIKMPKMDGIETTRIIKQEKPSTYIIAVSMFDEQEYISEMFSNGASAYLLKNTDE